MKATKIFLASVFALLFFVSNQSFADDVAEPCVPDCEETPWGPIQINTFDMGCMGAFKIWWTYRIACTQAYQDLQIVKVEWIDQTIKYNCITRNWSQEERYKGAIKALFAFNPMGFAPVDYGCSNSWRVASKSCWADFEVVIFDPTQQSFVTKKIMVACNEGECCFTRMQVCRVNDSPNDDKIEVTNLGPTQNITCLGTYQIGSDIENCNGVCEWLFPGDDGTPYYEFTHNPQWTIIPRQGNLEIEQKEGIGSNAYYSNKKLYLQIYAENVNYVQVEFLDINGKLLYSDLNPVTNGINEIVINTDTFIENQIIFYNIKSGNRIFVNGKFINE